MTTSHKGGVVVFEKCSACGRQIDYVNMGESRYLGDTLQGHYHFVCPEGPFDLLGGRAPTPAEKVEPLTLSRALTTLGVLAVLGFEEYLRTRPCKVAKGCIGTRGHFGPCFDGERIFQETNKSKHKPKKR